MVGGVIGEVWGGFRVVGVLNFGVVLEDFGVVERFWGVIFGMVWGLFWGDSGMVEVF